MTEQDLDRVVYLAYQLLTSENLRAELTEFPGEDVMDATPETIIKTRLKTMFKRDECAFCDGAKGGVNGNENIIGGRVVCDYCTALLMNMRKL